MVMMKDRESYLMSFRLFLVVEDLHNAMNLVVDDRFCGREMEKMRKMDVHVVNGGNRGKEMD